MTLMLPAGTSTVRNFNWMAASQLQQLGQRFNVAIVGWRQLPNSSNHGLWQSDGSSGGTELLKPAVAVHKSLPIYYYCILISEIVFATAIRKLFTGNYYEKSPLLLLLPCSSFARKTIRQYFH